MNPAVAARIAEEQPIGYAVTDHDLRVVEVGGAPEVLGAGAGARLGEPVTRVVPALAGCEAEVRAVAEGEWARYERPRTETQRADGTPALVTVVVLTSRDAAGAPAGALVLVEDVTAQSALERGLAEQHGELRRLEEQLRRQNEALAGANAELQRLDDMKSMVISVAAHELRAPLSSIVAYLELVLDGHFGPLTAQQKESLEIAQASAQRLLTITRNLLDVTLLQAGSIELAREPSDLAALVDVAVAEMRPLLEARGHELSLDVAPDLPPAICDPARTVQVLGNLLDNACKYTPEGGRITVRVGRSAEADFLQLTIVDTGIGIAPDDREKLFERFFRTEAARAAGISGTGLGLHLVRSLVELHGGRLWMESEPGRGSAFSVTFPIAQHGAVAA